MTKETVTFRLEPFIAEKIEEEAVRRGKAKSVLLREIVHSWLEKFHSPKEAIVKTQDGQRVRIRYRMGSDEVEISSAEVI